ncbi:riboflavin synthase [Candidatus Peribacteria bacterium]|nr:riboflavin synthase [Candidatus Peribacteria bacterium]
MFTGIIEATAQILNATGNGVVIARPQSFDDLKIGSSVSVSGVCLSIVELTSDTMRFDVVDETLQKTTIGSFKKGDRVNLERAMRSDSRLDGHVVQGHVEGVGLVKSEKLTMKNALLVLQLQKSMADVVVLKGSIAVDGVSLTVADVQGSDITVALIPHTLKKTTLGSLKKGDQVNIETDILVRSHHAH